MAATDRGVRDRAGAWWAGLQRRRPGVAHAVRAYSHYKANNGDHLAAAITYFSFLALFPLILLAVSVTGFVLARQPHLQQQLFDSISRNAPGELGKTISSVVTAAVQDRTSVGIVGLAGVALTGLGWIANLRTAIDTVWGLTSRKRSFLAAKAADALVLVGLGIGLVLSLGVTAGGTAASGYLLRRLHLDGVTGAGTFASVLAILLGIAGSTIIFGWLMVRLPDVEVSRRTAVRASVLAAIGFEILKIVGTYYIARVTRSPAGAVIGPVVGILVWIDLVSRYLLYCVAWAAVVQRPTADRTDPALVSAAAPGRRAHRQPGTPSPVGVAVGLVSAGAALGAGALAWQQRKWRRRPRQRPRG